MSHFPAHPSMNEWYCMQHFRIFDEAHPARVLLIQRPSEHFVMRLSNICRLDPAHTSGVRAIIIEHNRTFVERLMLLMLKFNPVQPACARFFSSISELLFVESSCRVYADWIRHIRRVLDCLPSYPSIPPSLSSAHLPTILHHMISSRHLHSSPHRAHLALILL